MNNLSANKLLEITHHRPTWSQPAEKWVWYQEWNKALFFHWKIAPSVLQNHIPPAVQLDTVDGNAWVSLVAFTMEQIRPRRLPAVSFISNFHEINLRTYVTDGKDHGVYFLSIDAQKQLSAFLSRRLSGLPYEKAHMQRHFGKWNAYHSVHNKTMRHLKVQYKTGNAVLSKTELDRWLTERYYLYLDQGQQVFKYGIHHEEWPLSQLDVDNVSLSYRIDDLHLSPESIEIAHYSEGVKVIAWPRKELTKTYLNHEKTTDL